jgi:YD repeat-containing protein
MPSGEGLGLRRVVEVQEWTTVGGTAITDFTHKTYDAGTGQPTSIASNEGTVNYTYDQASGRKVRMWTGTDPNNAPDDTAYGYDSQSRLTDVYTLVLNNTRYATYGTIDPTTHNPSLTGTPLDTHYTYDLAGNLKTESQPDQTTTTYSYDDENRLTDLATENTASNEPVFAEHDELNADGTRKDVTDTRYNTDGSVFSQTKVNWGYDGDGRLTSEALIVLQGGANAPAAYTNVFKFDLDGNRVEEDLSGSQNATVTYTYNGNNQLLTETRIGDGAYSTSYGYDDAGNQTSQVRPGTNPETDTYTWDLRGRMATATVGGVQTAYTYDTNAVRTSETTGSTSTYYLNDPNNPTGYTIRVNCGKEPASCCRLRVRSRPRTRHGAATCGGRSQSSS